MNKLIRFLSYTLYLIIVSVPVIAFGAILLYMAWGWAIMQ